MADTKTDISLHISADLHEIGADLEAGIEALDEAQSSALPAMAAFVENVSPLLEDIDIVSQDHDFEGAKDLGDTLVRALELMMSVKPDTQGALTRPLAAARRLNDRIAGAVAA